MKGFNTDDYRAALSEGHLVVSACQSCGRHQTIPAETCFECGSDRLEVSPHAGAGRILSWVVTHYAFFPELAEDVPYTVLLVALDGGGRAYGRLEKRADQPGDLADLPVVLDAQETASRGYPLYRLAAA